MIVAGVACLLVAFVLLTRSVIVGRKNEVCLQGREIKNPRVAVLIPARDESAVIGELLNGLLNQSVRLRSQDIFVIVESVDDPTVEICVKHKTNLIVRHDLENDRSRQRKGYALDIAVKEILQKDIKYDVFFVFDADNVLSDDYIEKMLTYYMAGYDMATGYRNSKNGNKSVIAAVSSLTFSMINVIGNRARIKHDANIVFSGTGFFVDGELVREWNGWPFHGLTEDYEMSLYATLHGLKTYYNEAAVFYDEQPLQYRQTVNQRVRWIRGYFDARKKYVPLMRQIKHASNYGSLKKEITGVWPIILGIIGVLLITVGVMTIMMTHGLWWMVGVTVLVLLVVIYLVLMLTTVVILRQEKLDLDRSTRLKTILFNPVYLVTYIPCAIKAILSKNVQWVKIKHGE